MEGFDRLLNVEEVSKLLGGIHIITLYKMAAAGQIPSVKIGRRVRFRESDLMKWIGSKVQGK